MEREIRFLERASILLRNNRKALISGETRALENALVRWTALEKEKEREEEKRAALLSEIARAFGMEFKDLNFSGLLPFVGGKWRARLEALSKRLIKVSEEAAIQAAVGWELLEQAARFNEGLLKSISRAIEGAGNKIPVDANGITILDTLG